MYDEDISMSGFNKFIFSFTMCFIIFLGVFLLVRFFSNDNYLNDLKSNNSNSLIYSGYSDELPYSISRIRYFYDNDSKVMYSYINGKFTPLYNSDGSLVTYDKWITNRDE